MALSLNRPAGAILAAMSSTATARQGVNVAPAGFRAVQELVNTDGGGQPDLLADTTLAQEWFSAVLAERAALAGDPVADVEVSFTARDLHKLIELRTRLRGLLHRATAGTPEEGEQPDWMIPEGVSVGMSQTGDGTVIASPKGTGWKLVASLLLLESWSAQVATTWPRLKVCRNDHCGVAFYDRSKNNSGVWHDVLVCGNAINLRASRARRRGAAAH